MIYTHTKIKNAVYYERRLFIIPYVKYIGSYPCTVFEYDSTVSEHIQLVIIMMMHFIFFCVCFLLDKDDDYLDI